MRTTLFAAWGGLLLGAALGCLIAFLLIPRLEPAPGWTTPPKLTDLANPGAAVRREVRASVLDPRVFYLMGLLLGGGFGSLVGALAGATRRVLLAIEKTGPTAGASE